MDFNDFLLVASKLKKDVATALSSSEAYRKEVKEIPAIVEGRRQRKELDNLSKKLEATIESRKVAGEDGRDGANGRDGSDGKDGTCGSDGSHGADGASGSDGSDAVHVTDADIDFDNRFTFSMSDGSELVTSNGLNLEDAVKAFGRGPSGPQGPSGAAGRDGTGSLQQVKLPYVNVESDYLTSGIAMGSGDEQNLLDSTVWNFTVEGDLLNQGTGTLDITSDNAFEPDFTGRVRMTCTVVFSSSSVPQGYLVIRNNGTDVSGYETFYKTHLDMTGTKLSSEIDIVIDVVAGDSIIPFFGVGSGSCDVHQSYTDILRLDFEASMTNGTDGTNGTNGADGIAGARWYSGNGAPSSSIGATGDYYLDGTSGNIWTRTPSQWLPSGENIMGPTGNGGSDILPLDNTWTGLNTFSGGNIVANAGNGLFYGAQGESTNVAIGSSALALATAGQNIGFGDSAGASLTTGIANLAVGASAMLLNVTGSGNVAVGQGALLFGTGSQNVAIGRVAGQSLVAGNNNTVIGSGMVAAFMNDTVLIGAGATERLKLDATGATINGTETVFTKEALQAVVAASTDFADFKTRVAAL